MISKQLDSTRTFLFEHSKHRICNFSKNFCHLVMSSHSAAKSFYQCTFKENDDSRINY